MNKCIRSEVVMTVIFWEMVLCVLVNGFLHCGSSCCLHYLYRIYNDNKVVDCVECVTEYITQ